MKEPITKVKRNYGIDMLRLVAMFFVVICHVLGHGGVMKNATGYNYSVSSLLQIVAYCAVNCYAIISGYVGYKEEDNYHYTKYLKFWIPVFFYSVGITIIFYVINSGSVGIKEIIWAFFPVTTYEYWYVNAYTALFFLIPWINRLIQNITEKELNRLIFVLFMFFSVYLTFSTWFADTFTLGGGYDFAWLIILYIAGAWIKKNKINEKWRVSFWITMITICIAATWLWETFAPVAKRLFVSYISVTIVLMAVGMVAIFSRLQLSSRMISIVRFFSPAAFGVYLIHSQTWIWRELMSDRFSWIANYKVYTLPFIVVGCAGGIFIICLLIEKLRLVLFEVLKINRLIQILERRLESVLNNCFIKIGG